MRYITTEKGYVVTVSFGADIECDWGGCAEYTGAVPAGYSSLEAWYAAESEKLCRWKVVNGQLTVDETAKAPKDKTIFDLIYPIGSIYMSVNPTSPADLFGGTWERIEDTFLLAASFDYDAGTTGGEAEHKLTEEEMPEHTHELTDGDVLGLRGIRNQVERFNVAAGSSYYAFAAPNMDGMVYDGNVASTGRGKAHNNMPPYLAVYMWLRVSDPGDEAVEVLPPEYTRLAYIESTGTQYLNSRFSAPDGFIAEVVFAYTGSLNGCIIGVQDTAAPYGRNYVCTRDGGQWVVCAGNTDLATGVYASPNTKYTIRASTVKGDVYLEVNGTRIGAATDSNARSESHVRLFTSNSDDNAQGRLYSAKIYDPDGNLVRNYVPVRTEGGRVGLYDFVTAAYFGYLSSTGGFIGGPVMEVTN